MKTLTQHGQKSGEVLDTTCNIARKYTKNVAGSIYKHVYLYTKNQRKEVDNNNHKMIMIIVNSFFKYDDEVPYFHLVKTERTLSPSALLHVIYYDSDMFHFLFKTFSCHISCNIVINFDPLQ